VTALREIKLLKELHDPNIIELVDVYPHKRNLHLVFEFMESDLEAVIRDRNIFLSPADYKSYMQMTLKGLAVCHKKWILHRWVTRELGLIAGYVSMRSCHSVSTMPCHLFRKKAGEMHTSKLAGHFSSIATCDFEILQLLKIPSARTKFSPLRMCKCSLFGKL